MKIELSEKEITLIVKSILPWYCVDINVDIDSNDEDDLFEITKKLYEAVDGKIDLTSLFIVPDTVYEQPEHVAKVKKEFNIK